MSIRAGPIRWVSVLRDLDGGGAAYYAAYGVPDARLAEIDLPGLWIDSVKIGAYPPFVRWRGKDLGLGLLDTLNNQSAAYAGLVNSRPMYLRAHRSHRCWTLTIDIRLTSYLFSSVNPPTFTPSLEQWRSYEAIASCLLRADLTRERRTPVRDLTSILPADHPAAGGRSRAPARRGWSKPCGQCGAPISRAAPFCKRCGWVAVPGLDEFLLSLGALGIPMQLMPRGAPEEYVKPSSWHSLGVIAINSGPIGWVNVLVDYTETGARHHAAYGVPDARLADADVTELKVESVKVRRAPFADRAAAVRWEGNDLGLGLLSALNGQRSVNAGLAGSGAITIQAHRSHRCWTLTIDIRLRDNLFSWMNPPEYSPSLEEWRSYEAVASCLLHADLTRD
jgi:hypothetical protein